MKELVEIEKSVNELRKYFFAELSIFKGVCGCQLTDRAKEVRILIASACSTGSAIQELGKNPQYFYSEMVMLARSYIEKITNFCYLQICTDLEFEKFLLHPLYRSFHNSDKTKFASGKKMTLKYTGRDEMKKNAHVLRALALFSETNPRQDWSDYRVDKKVAILADKTTLSIDFFLLNTLSLYSNASEALHGSLYGCTLGTGAFTPGIDTTNEGAIHENVLHNTALIYIQLGSITNELIRLLSSNSEVKPFAEASEKNQQAAVFFIKKIFNKDGAES